MIFRSLVLSLKISEGVCPFLHGLHGHWLLKAKKKDWGISLSSRISRSLVLLPKISEGVCLFRHGLHGHWLLKAKKKLGYIALVEDFMKFGLASKNFRRGVSVSARTSRTLAFEGKKENWGISLSLKISWSLVLFPKISEGVFPFWHGLHG